MSESVKSVIVLGGGSAGFLAAVTLKAKMPDLRVRVIRSPDIGIIGVGEGSTAALTVFLHDYLKVGLREFFEVAQPTWKLGLRFVWGPRPYFNYTFGPGLDDKPDGRLHKPVGFYCRDDIEYTDAYSALMTHDRAFERGASGPAFHKSAAYHFENEKLVRFLELSARSAGVEVVDGTVVAVPTAAGRVAGLTLASGETAAADLYVDCSGFRSELLGRALAEPFTSFRASLFCDRAVVGGWDRRDSPAAEDQVIKPYTTCETMASGWAWRIEHEHRINRGYVYCSDFVTDQAAEAEFRADNPRVGPTRVVRFVSGRYVRGWVGNVVAVGNASGFVEPLEATALAVIALQCGTLANSLLDADRELRPGHAAAYNAFHGRYWDSIRGFIALHYKFNTRLDTPFWRACRDQTDLAGAAAIADHYSENGPSPLWGATVLGNPYDPFGVGGYVTLLAGMKVPYRPTYAPTAAEWQVWNDRRRRLRAAAERAMTVREVLAAIRSPQWTFA